MQNEKTWIDYCGGRKYLLTFFCLVFAFVITVLNVLPATDFLEFMKFILSAYIVGNVANNVAENMKKSDGESLNQP